MTKARVWLGFAVSIIFLFIAFRGQDLGRIWSVLGRANYWYLVPGFVLYFTGIWIRSWRWAALLRPVRRLGAREMFPVVAIGYMANNVLPLRAGEFVRTYVLSTRAAVGKSAVLATIAVEKVFDGLTMLLFMLIASLSIALTAELRRIGMLAAALFGAVLIGLVLLSAAGSRDWILDRVLPRLPRSIGDPAARMAHSFLAGLGILRRKDELLAVTLSSIAAWLLEASMYAFAAQAFGLGLRPAAVLLVTAVANLATLIPSSPGYVGPFEAAILLALVGALGIAHETALSFAIAIHAALYFPITLIGLYFWWRESLSWRDVRGLSAEEVGD